MEELSEPGQGRALALGELLGTEGTLAQALPGYEHRPGQEQMIHAVAQAITRREVLLVEAGTGTGKTLGYLLPAVISGEQVVISTATRALQQQIYAKEIPFVRDVLGYDFRAALLKGRTNYLCKQRLEDARENTNSRRRHGAWLERIRVWAATSEIGDRAELSELPDDHGVWAEVSTGAEGCLGQRCAHYEDCFVFSARRRALEADVVVVNHHLFFADLSLRDHTGLALLPATSIVVFDEAHNIEDIAAQFFGASVSNWRIRDLVFDVERTFRVRGEIGTSLERCAETVHQRTEVFFGLYEPLLPKSRIHADNLPDGVVEAYHQLDVAIEALEQFCRQSAESDPVIERLEERCHELRTSLNVLAMAGDSSVVTWVEAGARATFIKAAPINVGATLQETLFARVEGLVFTSATLTTGGDFSHLKRRLGITFACQELTLPSPFDYPTQALLYVPPDLPLPRAPTYLDAACAEIEALVTITGGDALLLFTSFSHLRGAWERLHSVLPFPCFVQGQAPREALLEELRETPGAVLFATGSFWEGIDIVGPALSLVVIDKLPFAPPDDPLTSARIEWLQSQHRNPFMDYQVPNAVIALKQGFGRLIRSRADRGIVAILDPRLRRARYGRVFLDSLPPAQHIPRIEQLSVQWARLWRVPADEQLHES